MIKQNPFSVYDFLGYLIPGSVLIYSYIIIDYIKRNSTIDFIDFIKNLSLVKTDNILFFIILSYILGHLLSYTSSITTEKYAIWKYNYPSKYLLNITYDGFWKSAVKWQDIAWRIIIIIVLLPLVIFDWIFGELLGFKQFYKKTIDDLLKDIVSMKINLLIKKIGLHKLPNPEKYAEGKGNNYDFHRIVTHYAYEHSKSHQAKMSNYVALYGFLRTLSFIFNALSIYFFIRIILYLEFNLKNIIILTILMGISYLSFMAFMKFYRRYTLEGMMILAIDKDL